ncbi:DUF1439 domain-containing protein [Comamonas sp. MYb21]|uniref:DUF1439 domain-containing protein n=1 Tax=Comamonas sp. MYb21 TaxID=1848648 RepID=UPI0030974757
MRRRLFLASSLFAASMLAACSLLAPPSYTLSAAELQTIVAKSFPRSYPLLGLLQLDVQAPSLQLLPETNRIQATMRAEMSGKVLPHRLDGTMVLDFALRYSPADHSLRATQVQVQSLQMTGLPEAMEVMLQAYAPRAAEHAMEDVVVHSLRQEDLERLDKAAELPATFKVTAEGLRIEFVKPQDAK